MSYEPLPYASLNLKPHMNVALNLTSKLGNDLKAYKRYLISLIFLVHDGASDNVSKPELGEELTKALELEGCHLTEKIKSLDQIFSYSSSLQPLRSAFKVHLS